jgi:hypothetical protein
MKSEQGKRNMLAFFAFGTILISMELKAKNIQVMSAVTEQKMSVMVSAVMQSGSDKSRHLVTVRLTRRALADIFWRDTDVTVETIEMLSPLPDTWRLAAALSQQSLESQFNNAVFPAAIPMIRKEVYEKGTLARLKKELEASCDLVSWAFSHTLADVLCTPPDLLQWQLSGLLDYQDVQDCFHLGLAVVPMSYETNICMWPKNSPHPIPLKDAPHAVQTQIADRKKQIDHWNTSQVMQIGLPLTEYRKLVSRELGMQVISKFNAPAHMLFARCHGTKGIPFSRTADGKYSHSPHTLAARTLSLSAFKNWLSAMPEPEREPASSPDQII